MLCYHRHEHSIQFRMQITNKMDRKDLNEMLKEKNNYKLNIKYHKTFISLSVMYVLLFHLVAV